MKRLVNSWRLIAGVIFMMLFAKQVYSIKYSEGDLVDYTMFRYITSIAADQRVVYFGTTGGIIRYDRFSKTWLDPMTATNGLPSNYIKELAYDTAFDELWALTSNGVAKYNFAFESWFPDFKFPSDLVINHWNASRFPSLFTPFRYEYQDGYISDPYMRNFKITVGFEDNNDLMYVGTWGMGPVIINTRYLNMELMVFGPYNSNISKVIEIDNFLWMGTDYTRAERGLTRYNLNLKQWKYFEPEFTTGLGNAELTTGLADKEFIWLGTKGGLVLIDEQETFKTYGTFSGLPSENILSLAEYGGFIYIGTENGLGILPSTGEVPDSTFKSPLPEKYRFYGQRINDLLVFRGSLYIATNDGAYRFDSDRLKIQHLDTPSHDLASEVNDIFTDSQKLYFAVKHGVIIIDVNTGISKLATDFSLADRWVINEIYSDSTYIWGATSLGLWRYKKADETTLLYTTADGFPENNINSLVKDGDYLWLGCREGLVRFLWNAPGRGD